MNAPDDTGAAILAQSEAGYAHRVTRRLIVLMTAVMVLSSLAVATLTLNDFNRLLTPELGHKARMIGGIVAADLRRALGYGIPLEAVYGADPYLEGMVEDHDELTYVAIVGSDGTLLYRGGAVADAVREFLEGAPPPEPAQSGEAATELGDALDHAVPIVTAEGVIGAVHVGIDRRYVQRQLDDIFFDIMVILVAAVLVTLEVMLALVLVYGTGPIRRLNLLLDQQARGDFAHVLSVRARDAVGRAAYRLSEGARTLHAGFHAACTRVGATPEALRADAPLGDTGARLHAVGARFGLLAVAGPTPLRRAGPSDVRIPLFIFAFAEELQKSFLPLFVREVYTPIPWLSEPVVIGLPIVVYLFVLAVAAPFAGGWAEHYGSRRLFLAGLVPSVAGFLGCAVADGIGELVAWRGVTALGYAMVTIGCQDYVIASSAAGRWGRNLIVFVGIIMSASMCGTAIGGILADRMGYHAVFALAALLALLAGAIAAGTLTDEHDRAPGPAADSGAPTPGRLRGAVIVLANLRFILFLLCVAVPANVLIAAYLWYLVPLYLSDLGGSISEIARVIMVYYLLIVVVGPLASQVADRPGRLGWLVGLGSFLSAGGLVAFYDWRSIWAVVLTVVVLGLTHALAKGAQVPLALEICAREIAVVGRTTVLSVLRFLERMGSMLGLLVAAALIEAHGYAATTGIIGALVSGAALLFLVVHLASRKSRATAA